MREEDELDRKFGSGDRHSPSPLTAAIPLFAVNFDPSHYGLFPCNPIPTNLIATQLDRRTKEVWEQMRSDSGIMKCNLSEHRLFIHSRCIVERRSQARALPTDSRPFLVEPNTGKVTFSGRSFIEAS